MKQKAIIPIANQIGDIHRLELETDENDTGGVLLYSFYSKDEAYDTWFKNIDIALEYVQKTYNIKKEDWIIEKA